MRHRNSQRGDLVEAAREYFQQYKGSPAEQYVTDRGLGNVAEQYGLGFIGSARTGDEQYQGRLVIPYLRPAPGPHSVATMRFRCIEDHDCKASHGGKKYLGYPGDPGRLFNTPALIKPSHYMCVVEGELDPIAAATADVPAVGVPGTGQWQEHFTDALIGYETVYVIADGDEPGHKFAEEVAAKLPNAKRIYLGEGCDTNSFIQEFGTQAFRERLGL